MAAAVVMGALMVGCQEPGGETTPPTDFVLVNVDNAEYFGESRYEGLGFYKFTLSDKTGNAVNLVCFANVAPSASNPRLTSGTYNPGSMTEPTVRTFITTASVDDEDGTTFTINGTEYPVDGGTVTVTSAVSTYTIDVKLTSGETEFKGKFTDGSIKFTPIDPLFPDRTAEPNPRPITYIEGSYSGPATPNDETALIVIDLVYKGENLGTTNAANVEALQLSGYIPVQENSNEVILPTGTYTIGDANSTTAFNLLRGSVDSENGYTNSFEYYTDASNTITKGYIIEEGTMIVSQNGEEYTITVNMKGKRADQAEIIGDKLEEISYSYTGSLEPLTNLADPTSTLDDDINLGTFTNNAHVEVYRNAQNANGNTVWYYYICDEGLNLSVSGGSLSLSGEGNMIILALFGPKECEQSDGNPLGTFEIGPFFGTYFNENGYTAMPGQPMAEYSETGISPNAGCYYTYIQNLTTIEFAGAMPNIGQVITKPSDTPGNQIVEFEFQDRFGHTISGTYDGPMQVTIKDAE